MLYEKENGSGNKNRSLLHITFSKKLIDNKLLLCYNFTKYSLSFFTALNNGIVSAIILFLRTLVFQIVMIFLLPKILGLNGIWLAVVFAEILSFCVSISFLIINREKYKYI